jgi:hypothetical protein
MRTFLPAAFPAFAPARWRRTGQRLSTSRRAAHGRSLGLAAFGAQTSPPDWFARPMAGRASPHNSSFSTSRK